MKIYCKKVIINKPEILQSQGPLLLACNHPNSFLDGIILTTLFEQPVYSLARGDAFSNRHINKLLRWLQLLPVYRTSEGVENLNHNYATFATCQDTFANKGIVMIFSEGGCENEWHLRPLKKGTARLAIAAWKNNVSLNVLPVAINYSSFDLFGKEVHIYFGNIITEQNIQWHEPEGKQFLHFNKLLSDELKPIVYEIDPSDKQKRRKIFNKHIQSNFYIILLPALAGFILHAPIFYISKLISKIIFGKTVHYDSSLISILYILYPFYIILLFIIIINIHFFLAISTIILMPFLAYLSVQAKYQLNL